MLESSPEFPPAPYTVQEVSTTQARKDLSELVSQAAYGHVQTVLVRDGRRLARIIPEEDAWFYSPVWQEKINDARDDIAAGRVSRAMSADDMFSELDSES